MANETRDYSVFIRSLNRLIKGNMNLQKALVEDLLKTGAKDLGSRLAMNTPVYDGQRDDYPAGQLRKGWFGGKDDVNVGEYVDRMRVQRNGSDYEITFKNEVKNTSGLEFGSFVEEGHEQEVGRYVGHNGVNARLVRPFVEGLKFTERSLNETEANLPHLMEGRLQDVINETFEGKK